MLPDRIGDCPGRILELDGDYSAQLILLQPLQVMVAGAGLLLRLQLSFTQHLLYNSGGGSDSGNGSDSDSDSGNGSASNSDTRYGTGWVRMWRPPPRLTNWGACLRRFGLPVNIPPHPVHDMLHRCASESITGDAGALGVVAHSVGVQHGSVVHPGCLQLAWCSAHSCARPEGAGRSRRGFLPSQVLQPENGAPSGSMYAA